MEVMDRVETLEYLKNKWDAPDNISEGKFTTGCSGENATGLFAKHAADIGD